MILFVQVALKLIRLSERRQRKKIHTQQRRPHVQLIIAFSLKTKCTEKILVERHGFTVYNVIECVFAVFLALLVI